MSDWAHEIVIWDNRIICSEPSYYSLFVFDVNCIHKRFFVNKDDMNIFRLDYFVSNSMLCCVNEVVIRRCTGPLSWLRWLISVEKKNVFICLIVGVGIIHFI